MNMIYNVCEMLLLIFPVNGICNSIMKKSNVLIIGKRTNEHNRLWQLGDDCISEVETYKYLGVHIIIWIYLIIVTLQK